MKKRLLFSLAFASVLMAGCQQDEFVGVNNDVANVDLSNRPMIGSVSLSNVGAPSTRMALNPDNKYSFKWEEGDKLGAAIVDMPVETAKSGQDFTATGGKNYSTLSFTYQEYVDGVAKDFNGEKVTAIQAGVNVEEYYVMNSTSYISSNYPYTLAAGTWTTPANLVEGNYVFYAPFNPSHMTRKPLIVTLPMEQSCTTESEAVEKFYKGKDPVALANAFLAAPADPTEIIQPSLKTTNIFAYPQITIKNDYNGYLFDGADAEGANYYSSAAAQTYTMKLKKIEIYTTSKTASLNYKSVLDVAKYKTAVTTNGWDDNKKADDTSIFTTGKTSAILSDGSSRYDIPAYPAYSTDEAAAVTEMGYATEYYDDGTADDLISAYNQKHITCDLGGKELKSGESYKFFTIMPAEDYENLLFAKVYVEINGKNYIILNGEISVETKAGANKDKAYITDVTTPLADYNFRDKQHGDQGVRLVRGQRYPSAEVLEDASGVKSFAGTLMTINLKGGIEQAAYAMQKVVPTVHKGIKDNADFIDHITKNVQRGVSLIEKASVEVTDRTLWEAQDIAFDPNNTVIINAELITALYNRLYDKRPDGTATGNVLTLKATKLPIAKDVKVELKNGTTYTFTALDNTTSYDINFDDASLINTDPTVLINGINKVTTGTLTIATGTTGAVVIANAAVTLSNTTGINGIYIPASKSLTVNCSTDALIALQGGSITMGKDGVLTNTNNILTNGTIDNTKQKTIAGDTKGATVEASITGWPLTTIASATRINKLSINFAADTSLPINKAEIDKLANLSDVDVVLGDKVKGITSSANVTLTKIKSMSSNFASEIQWTATGDFTVTYVGAENTFFTNIAAGTGVTFSN